jgi:copper transport protein
MTVYSFQRAMTAKNRPSTEKTTSTTRLRRGLPLTAFGRVAAAAFLIVLVPSILLAHARLVRSEPSAGQRLTASPSRIRLIFSETPMVAVSRIILMGSRGNTVRTGPARVDPTDAHAMIADLTSPLDSGSYAVHWATAASDGHASHGTFWFRMASPAVAGESPPATATEEKPEQADSESTADGDKTADAMPFSIPLALGRWLGFLALFSLIGAVAFRYAILGRMSSMSSSEDAGDPFNHIASVGAATYGLFAAVALVVATVIKLYGESLSMHDIALRTILFGTGWGWVWIVQMTACVVAILAFRTAHNRAGAGWPAALLCALVLAATPALSGHAIASDDALFTVPLDVLHVLAGSVWLGTLSAIVLVGIGSASKTPGAIGPGKRVAEMINAFSPVALVCGGTIVATGVIVSLLHVEPLSRLWTSGYGVTLLVKLLFVGILFAFGAWNWRRIKPTLGADSVVRPLFCSARFELLAGAAVLAATAILIAMALPG